MLIITRKCGESFFIGDNIQITIFDIGTDRVRIGIEAPVDVPIFRKEIKDIREENLKASKAATAASDEKLRGIHDFIRKNTSKK